MKLQNFETWATRVRSLVGTRGVAIGHVADTLAGALFIAVVSRPSPQSRHACPQALMLDHEERTAQAPHRTSPAGPSATPRCSDKIYDEYGRRFHRPTLAANNVVALVNEAWFREQCAQTLTTRLGLHGRDAFDLVSKYLLALKARWVVYMRMVVPDGCSGRSSASLFCVLVLRRCSASSFASSSSPTHAPQGHRRLVGRPLH